MLSDAKSVEKLLTDCLSDQVADAPSLSEMMVSRLGNIGCKTALRLAERAVFTAGLQQELPADETKSAQLSALQSILDDFAGDEALAARVCEVI